jgi:hypothetical protein
MGMEDKIFRVLVPMEEEANNETLQPVTPECSHGFQTAA